MDERADDSASRGFSTKRRLLKVGQIIIMMTCEAVSREELAVAEMETLTVTLPADTAAAVKGAVERGEYASSGDVVREALRDWGAKRTAQQHEMTAIKALIDKGLADLAEGRVQDFDAARISERGRALLTAR